MSETPIAYHVPPAVLDACVQRGRLPAQPDFTAASDNLPPELKLAAEQVVEHSFRDIAHHLGTPAELRVDPGRRTVRLWNQVDISVADDGTDFRLEHPRRDWEASRCIAWANLTRPIGGFTFISAFDAVLVASCRATGLPPGLLTGPTGNFIRRAVGRTFRRYVDWNRLRRSVLTFLAPDPLLMSLTQRTFMGGYATIHSFNWVARNLRELSLIAIERPRLLPFLQIVGHMKGSPLANFDWAMVQAGMMPAARRKLERWGYDAFPQAASFDTRGDSWPVMAQFANLLDRLQVMDPPNTTFTELATRGVRPDAPDWYLRALLNEVESLAEDCPDDPYPLDFEVTAHWLATTPQELDDNQKQAGWRWIVAQAWKHHLATSEDAQQPWPVPCEAFAVGRFTIAPIPCLASLLTEAEAMRNCLATMEAECRTGRIAVLSIREDGRRVACFRLARVAGAVGFWQLKQVAGKANAPVDEEITEVAVRATARLNST